MQTKLLFKHSVYTQSKNLAKVWTLNTNEIGEIGDIVIPKASQMYPKIIKNYPKTIKKVSKKFPNYR